MVETLPKIVSMQDALPEPVETQTRELVEHATAVVVKDQVTLDQAADFTRSVKGQLKKLEDIREELLGPLKLHIKTIEERRFREPIASLKEAEKVLKAKTATFLRAAEEIRLVEQRRIQMEHEVAENKRKAAMEKMAEKAMKKGADDTALNCLANAEYDIPAPVAPPKIFTPAGTQLRKKPWDCVVEDESLVPREYLMPNIAKIKKIIQGNDGGIKIPGVRNFQDYTTAQGS